MRPAPAVRSLPGARGKGTGPRPRTARPTPSRPFPPAGTFALPPTLYPGAPLSLLQTDVFRLQWCVFFPHKTRRSRADHWLVRRFGFPCASPCSPASRGHLGRPGSAGWGGGGRQLGSGRSLLDVPVAQRTRRDPRPQGRTRGSVLPSPTSLHQKKPRRVPLGLHPRAKNQRPQNNTLPRLS